jgi:hypothetical protein
MKLNSQSAFANVRPLAQERADSGPASRSDGVRGGRGSRNSADERDRRQHDRGPAEQERERRPGGEEKAAADERCAEAEAAHDALDPDRAPAVRRRYEVGEERLVGRVVDEVAYEEERDERHRGRVRVRERDQGERHDEDGRGEDGVRKPAPETRARAVRERADEHGEEEGEEALAADREADGGAGVRLLAQEDGRVRRQDAHREREAERRQRERPDEPADVPISHAVRLRFHGGSVPDGARGRHGAGLPLSVWVPEPSEKESAAPVDGRAG